MKKLMSIVICVLVMSCFLLPNIVFADCSVTLEWSANSESDLAGYRAFYREEGQSYYYTNPAWEGIETTTIISGLDYTKDYYFVVRAFDTEGYESGNSNEVSSVTGGDPEIGVGPDNPQGLAVTKMTCD